MSLSLLLDKYDVSTEDGLQKALHEIEKEESEVNESLSSAVSRACVLEGRLRSAGQSFERLGAARSDAQTAGDMVERTAELARDVSAKVRQLDLARSRVAECQRRVHDLIDLRLCSAGVEEAIRAQDLETAAGHVSRFLSMDPGSLAAARRRGGRGAPDPRPDMAQAADTTHRHLLRKFEEAARAGNATEVERLFKLFPLIGKADEGVTLLGKFLAEQLESTIRRCSVVTESRAEGAVFADALTRVLEAGGASVERARAVGTSAPGRLHGALVHIQPVVCSGARRVVSALVSARGLSQPEPQGPAEPLAREPAAAELALAHSRLRLYFSFVRRKAEMDAAPLEEEAKQTSLAAVEKILGECDLMRTAQDILGHYLAVERYFLEESVNKALKMAAPAPGATSSSLVDDVFYITRKVIRRSISTGSVDGACAVLNDAAALLERNVAGALRRWVRAPPPEPLALPPPGAAPGAQEPGALASRINREVDAQRLLFLAHMTEAESGAEWSERLAAEACADAEPLIQSASEREKLHSCASNLGAAAAAFRAAHDLALAGVKAALKPRVNAWAEVLADPDGEPDEEEADAAALPLALESLSEAARAHGLGAHDALLAAVVSDIAQRAESRILANRYDREGGLLVERRCRRLSAWAGGGAAGARERCARLVQAAGLLALERVQHAADALQPHARLAPHTVRDILGRRTDFKIEEIRRLKL